MACYRCPNCDEIKDDAYDSLYAKYTAIEAKYAGVRNKMLNYESALKTIASDCTSRKAIKIAMKALKELDGPWA